MEDLRLNSSLNWSVVFLFAIFVGVGCAQPSHGGKSDEIGREAKAAPTPVAGDLPPDKLPKPLAPPSEVTKSDPIAITSVGSNSGGVYSADGKKIFFVSSARPAHAHSQAYVLDLEKQKERRLTHQDGDIQGPTPIHQGNEILYASTTDEIKENPRILRIHFEPKAVQKESESPWRFLPFELYLADADNSTIRRLTERPGFDGEATLASDGQTVYFASLVKDELQLFRMSLNKTKPELLLKKADKHVTQPVLSPNGKRLAWVELAKQQDAAQIYVGNPNAKEEKILTTSAAIHWAPSWHPTEPVLVFTSNRVPAGSFEIFTLDLEKPCLRRWTYHEASDTLPVFSPDGKNLLFTSNRSGRNQLYQLPYQTDRACLKEEVP